MFEQPSPNRLGFAEFVEAFRRQIEQLPGHSAAVFDTRTRMIGYLHGAKTYTVNPNNYYIDYGKSDGDLGAFLQTCSSGLLSMQAPRPQSLADAAPNLLPVVRDRRYLDMAILMAKVSATKAKVEIPRFPFRALAGEWVVTLGLDTPTATSVVAATELEAWGASFDAAHQVALDNLRARTQGNLNELRPGLYVSRWSDGYDASRLLLPELFKSLKLRGEPVVSAPSRNLLVVAGSEDPAALTALTEITAKVLGEETRPLSADLLHMHAQGWREAAASVSQQPRLLKARQLLLQRDYNQQAELLNQLNQAQGKDIFVASYKLGESNDDEPYRNITQVTEGVSLTLLPKADELAFLTTAQEFLLVPWAVAEEVLGPALKRLAIHPVRYRHQGFPDAAQLEVLRSKASIRQAPPEPNQRMAAAAEDFPRTYRIPAQPANPRMQQMLVQARDKFARLRTAAVAGTLDTMHAECPKWLTHRDPLIEVSRNQALLLREGRIVWAALVMANNLLFKPGKEDCPALLVYSLDEWYESRPDELHAIARRIFELKNSEPAEPGLRALAKLVTEESDRGMGWRVPEALTDKDVRGSIFMVFRKHIPSGQMCGERFPILVHPSTEAVMMLPFEGWPAELVKSWKPGSNERSLDEVRALPEGLRVTHTPDLVVAVKDAQDGREFVWSFQTRVEAMDSELDIVEFGAFRQLGGKWGPANGGERPFGPHQFAVGYG